MEKGIRNYTPETKAKVRRLRREMSRSEKRLWYDGLSGCRLGFRFRRQYPVGPYALDFFCSEARLCVEVDGDHHEHRVLEDALRDRYLAERGIETLRVAADSVYVDLGGVLFRIGEKCRERAGQS